MNVTYIIAFLVIALLAAVFYYSRTIGELNKSAVTASASATAAQQKALEAQKLALQAAYEADTAKALAYQQQNNKTAQLNAVAAQKAADEAACKANMASLDAANKQQCAADTSKALADAVAKAKSEQYALDQQNALQMSHEAVAAAVAAQQQISAAEKANAVKQAIADAQASALLTQQQALATQASEYANKLQTAVSAAIASQKVVDFAIITSRPSKFLMQNTGASNNCLTFPSSGPPTFTTCDTTGNTGDQVLFYDLVTNTFRNKDGNCVDDGGVSNTGNPQFRISSCYQMPNFNRNQTFHYWADSSNIRNPYKNICLDSNFGKSLHYWNCDASNKNQQWTLTPLL